jgi:hypothetical protein
MVGQHGDPLEELVDEDTALDLGGGSPRPVDVELGEDLRHLVEPARHGPSDVAQAPQGCPSGRLRRPERTCISVSGFHLFVIWRALPLFRVPRRSKRPSSPQRPL